METDARLTQILQLAKKSLRVIITYTLYVQKLNRDMECIKQTQIELLEMKTAISEMKNTLERINGRLDIARGND